MPNLRTLAAAAALLSAGAVHLAAQQAPSSGRAISEDVRHLADDSLAGRLTGSPGADSAAAYLARRFAQAGLQPAAGGWFQSFTVAKDAPAAAQAGVAGAAARNVVGLLPGRDPTLRNEIVIVGAHYDHLGRGGFGALDPDSTGKIHNGADDNASGAAALIHIAARLAASPPARSVLFIAFTGEEEGLLGSEYYIHHPLYGLDHTVAMINLDMVGRLRNDRLIVFGAATAAEFPALLDSLNQTAKFDLKPQGDGYGPSDQASFYAAKLPVLYLFTDLHPDYHRTTDDWDKINFDGLRRVVDFAASLTRALANRRQPLSFRDLPAPMAASQAAASTSGYGAYLGTIPDMAGSPGGVRISGVRAGSPAAQAGLQADDIITRIGTLSTPNLEAMTEALRSHQPGDSVEIVVRRGDNVTVLHATLGRRGG